MLDFANSHPLNPTHTKETLMESGSIFYTPYKECTVVPYKALPSFHRIEVKSFRKLKVFNKAVILTF
jgi:hypothetical protein